MPPTGFYTLSPGFTNSMFDVAPKPISSPRTLGFSHFLQHHLTTDFSLHGWPYYGYSAVQFGGPESRGAIGDLPTAECFRPSSPQLDGVTFKIPLLAAQ